MMATVDALNINIHLHGQSNSLLSVEGRLPLYTIHLLYCWQPIDGNRGNHYDALIPINLSTAPDPMETFTRDSNLNEDSKNELAPPSIVALHLQLSSHILKFYLKSA